MIVDCKGIAIDSFFIPPFHLDKGEIIGINLYNGIHSEKLRRALVSFLEGKEHHDNVVLSDPFLFADYFRENRLRSFFMPDTIENFIEEQETFDKLQQLEPWVKKNMRMISLPWNIKRWASLLKAVRKNSHIIFDLGGLDPSSIVETMHLLSRLTDKGASIIVIDYWASKLDHCNRKYDVTSLNGVPLSVWRPEF
jgi:hypothetical protein